MCGILILIEKIKNSKNNNENRINRSNKNSGILQTLIIIFPICTFVQLNEFHGERITEKHTPLLLFHPYLKTKYFNNNNKTQYMMMKNSD